LSFSAKDLVGAWSFVDWAITGPDGAVSRPFQPTPSGYIIYSADGVMSAVIQAGGRARFPSDNIRKRPAEEKAAAFDSYFHYAGTWFVRGDDVVHNVTMAMNPNMIGTQQVRHVALSGDDLTLSATEPLENNAGARHHTLKWRRQRP
jgi:hypothetical protein